jgi:sugar phosphate isomerase/epimerase
MEMLIGFYTAPFRNEPFERVVEFASKAGFKALEVMCGVGSGHIDAQQVLRTGGGKIKQIVESAGLTISALAMYGNTLAPDPTERRRFLFSLHKVIDAAATLGVEVVCTLAGMPMPNKTKLQTIEEDAPKAFRRICEHAAEKGVKIALENWYATNLQTLMHWDRFFEVVNYENIGLNFDPSHLVWQDIDYLYAAEKFADRIFHVHAKDTTILWHRRRYIGNQEHGWWRYVIPGFGVIDWGQLIGILRSNGYDGVLSIEHEDASLPREEGLIKGLKYLRQFV